MPKEKISITINSKTLYEIDNIIDNVYIRNRSAAIEHLINNSLGGNKSAVILLGGPEESLSIGKDEFSPIARIKGSTVIEIALRKLRENGFKSIFVVARHNLLTKIFEVLKDGSGHGVKINYIEEQNSKGTADSLRGLKGELKSNFLVVYGDIIFSKLNLEGLWNDHIKQSSVATIMLTTSSNPNEKGTVRVEGNKVLSFTQKPKKSDIYLVFSPIFVAEPNIFSYSGHSLEIDVFPTLAEKGLLNGHLSSEKEIHIHSAKDLELHK